MPLTAEEGKAKRLEGLRQEKMGLSAAGRVHRAFSKGDSIMSTLRTRLSTDTWAILLAAALGLAIRFGLLRTIAW